MTYSRVLPRDLFNDAKLLKCIGKLTLLIQDQTVNGLPLTFEYDDQAFDICQDIDGNIFVSNIEIMIADEPVIFYTPMNAREAWPLMCIYNDEYCEVFDGSGNLATDFGLEVG